PPPLTLVPSTTLFRSPDLANRLEHALRHVDVDPQRLERKSAHQRLSRRDHFADLDVPRRYDAGVRCTHLRIRELLLRRRDSRPRDRKSTRLNSSHVKI